MDQRKMHDTVKDTHWHEPKAGQNAGFGNVRRPKLPYDRFMEDEGVPIYRGVGVHKVQNLPMKPWKRLGGRGSYIQLFGIEALWGLYIVEVPAGDLPRDKIIGLFQLRGMADIDPAFCENIRHLVLQDCG